MLRLWHCPEYEIKKKGILSFSSSKKPFKKPLHRNSKSINAMTSSPGEGMCPLDYGENDAIDASASDVFTPDIDLDQKVASVIRHESHSSSDESSIDDFDLHRDGFTFGDFDPTMVAIMSSTDDHSIDLDYRVAAVSADFSVSIDDLSESSSSDSDNDAVEQTN